MKFKTVNLQPFNGMLNGFLKVAELYSDTWDSLQIQRSGYSFAVVATKSEKREIINYFSHSNGNLFVYRKNGYTAHEIYQRADEVTVNGWGLAVVPSSGLPCGRLLPAAKEIMANSTAVSIHGFDFDVSWLPIGLKSATIHGTNQDFNFASLLPNIESLSLRDLNLKSVSLGNHPKLATLEVTEGKPSATFSLLGTPLFRQGIFNSGNQLTASEIALIVNAVYALEQTRSKLNYCMLYLSGTGNATPNADSLSKISWLRSNRGWTVLHN